MRDHAETTSHCWFEFAHRLVASGKRRTAGGCPKGAKREQPWVKPAGKEANNTCRPWRGRTTAVRERCPGAILRWRVSLDAFGRLKPAAIQGRPLWGLWILGPALTKEGNPPGSPDRRFWGPGLFLSTVGSAPTACRCRPPASPACRGTLLGVWRATPSRPHADKALEYSGLKLHRRAAGLSSAPGGTVCAASLAPL